jgi:hypothetical protein
LREIRQVVESFARDVYEGRADHSVTDPDGLLQAALDDLGWHTVAQCSADFERLEVERHTDAHPGVIAPPASAVIEEVDSIRRRLRMGAEAVRRRLIGANEEWFPFIERIYCPQVANWNYWRGRSFPQPAALGEGDEIEFVVSALNTDGSASGLRYGLYVQPDGGGSSPLSTTTHQVGSRVWQVRPVEASCSGSRCVASRGVMLLRAGMAR